MAKDNVQNSDMQEVEMIDICYEDGETLSCEVIAKFQVNSTDYVALLPLSDDEEDILVCRYTENSDDDIDLDEITDEDEFNQVADALDKILDEMEFNSESQE
jgi:hypothetical protein